MNFNFLPKNATFVIVEVVDGERRAPRRMGAEVLAEMVRPHLYGRFCPAFATGAEAVRANRMARRVPGMVEDALYNAWENGRVQMSGHRRGWSFDVKASWFTDAQ